MKEKRATVSVIVPVYNSAPYLGQLLLALSKQDYPACSIELVFIDNGSVDNSLEILEKFQKTASIKVVVSREWERPGSYAARNKGILLASGDVLAFTDSDCIPHEQWLFFGVKEVEDSPEQAVVGGSVELTAEDPNRPTAAEIFDICYGFSQQKNIYEKGFSVTANLFVSRAFMSKVGGFDDTLRSKGDFEWCQRASGHGAKLKFVPESVVYHPARRTLKSLYTKVRRVAGGQRDYQNTLTSRKASKGMPDPPLPVRLARQVVWVLGQKKVQSFRHRVIVLAVGASIVVVKYVEVARLRLGGESERR